MHCLINLLAKRLMGKPPEREVFLIRCPLPEGNMYNVNSPNGLAPGYLGAPAVSFKGVVIVPVYLKEHPLQGKAILPYYILDAAYNLSAPPG